MPVKYFIEAKRHAALDEVHIARIAGGDTADFDEVLDLICRGDEAWKSHVRMFFQAIPETVRDLLASGRKISTPAVVFGLSIRGRFTGTADEYDPARHNVRVLLKPGRAMLPVTRHEFQLEKTWAPVRDPVLDDFQDCTRTGRRGAATPGGGGIITGRNLKYDPDDPEQGIFFIADDGAEIRANAAIKTRDKEILFQIPDGLRAGTEYRIEVRRRRAGRVRTGALQGAVEALEMNRR